MLKKRMKRILMPCILRYVFLDIVTYIFLDMRSEHQTELVIDEPKAELISKPRTELARVKFLVVTTLPRDSGHATGCNFVFLCHHGVDYDCIDWFA